MSSSDPSSPPLNPTQVGDLQVLLGQTCATALATGFFVLLAGLAAQSLWPRVRDSVGVRFQLAAVVIIFVSNTLLLGIGVALNIGEITNLGPDPLPSTYFTRMVWLDIVTPRICYILSDLIVVWRAWVISENRIARWLLAVSMFITFGCTVVEGYLSLVPIYAANGADVGKLPRFDLFLFVPVLTTNTLSTLLILHKTWEYRQSIKVHLLQQPHNTRIEEVLILLVESGALYAAFWIVNLVLAMKYEDDPHPPVAANTIGSLLPRISAIYPVAIILLVARGRDRILTESDAPSDTMQFIPSPRRSFIATKHTTSIIQSLADRIRMDHPHTVDEESWIEMNRVGRRQIRSEYGSKTIPL